MSVNRVNFGVEDTGELAGNPEHDVLLNARSIIAEGKPVPRVYHACGTEDHAYPVALGLKEFFDSFEGNPFRYELHLSPGGHTDDFQDSAIREFIDTVFESRR